MSPKVSSKIIKLSLGIFVVVVLAIGLGFVLGGQLGVYLILFGLITGLNYRYLTLRRTIALVGSMVLMVFLASYFQGIIWAIVAIMGLSALATGFVERWAVGCGSLIPVAAIVSGTVYHTNSPFAVASWVAIGATISIVIIGAFKIKQKPRFATLTQIRINTAVLMFLAMIYTYIIISFDLPRGYWLIFTLCAVLKPGSGDTLATIRNRLAGTIFGAIGGLMIVEFLPAYLSIFILAAVMIGMIYFMLLGEYTKYVIFMTIMLVIILAKGSSESAFYVGDLRMLLTISSGLFTGLVALGLWRLERLIPARS